MKHPYLLILLTFFPIVLAADCAPAPSFYGYRFLNPAMVEYDSQLSPFYESFREYYPEAGKKGTNYQKQDNLAEWHERYCEQVDITDLEKTIYGSSVNDLQELLRVLSRPKTNVASLPDRLQRNTFTNHLMRYKCTEVVEYLLFAKQAEPLVGSNRSGFKQNEPRRVDMERLIDDGLEKFRRTKSHYVRLRYAYQLIRLAHYLKEYSYVLELHDYLMPKIEADPSIIYYWIEGHRAGALQSLGNYAESAYRFSRVFANCRSKRESAYRSFKIRTDEEWQGASNLCANDGQRAMLHVLRAQNNRAIVLEEMAAIYRLDPANKALEPLLMRELKELEEDLLGLDFNPKKQLNKRANRPRPGAARRLIKLQAFVNAVVRNDDSLNPDLWKLARGVIEMLAGDYFYARQSLDKVRRSDNDSIREQAIVMTEVTNLLALSKVTDSVELYYYNLLDDEELRARYPDLRSLVNDKLEAVYYATGRKGKAALMQYGFDALQKNPELGTLTELVGMGDSLLGNRFDKLLLNRRIGENAQDDINDLLGTYYLQRGQWEAGLEVFKRIPAARRDAYGLYYPFIKQFKDRVKLRQSTNDMTQYNKVDLLERLVSLEEEAKRTLNDTIATRNYFSIGLAHYNMSYYSYNWRFSDPFRSGASGARAVKKRAPDWVFSHPEAPFGNKENFNMDRARYYFERALSRAPIKEAAAEAIYYSAKTERNQNYAAARARTFGYFQNLQEGYSDTRFYQRTVEECKTFAWFVAR